MIRHAANEIRDNPSVALLATVGAAEGAYKYYLQEHLTAKNAWLALGGLILAYELAAPQGELLSEGADRALETHPWLTRGIVGVTALHLINVLPPRIDPFTNLLNAIKG